MKRIITLIAFFAMLSACEKDFLDRQPIVGTVESNYYNTADEAIAAVNAAYSALQFEMTPGGHFRWFWGDIMSDDSDKGGSGDNDVVELLQLENFQGPTNTELLESEWKANFEGIYRANVALKYVPGIEMDEALKQRIIGEAKFLRAWYNYNQVTIFGGVPLVDHVLEPSEYNIPRNTAAEIWAFIEEDLNAAIDVLPLKSQYPDADLGRATKGAAQALLLKSLMYQSRFGEAQTIAETIVESMEYELAPDYNSIFTTDGENGPGSIFEIQYMNASGGNWGYNANNEGTFSNVFQRARGIFQGYGFNLPTQNFVDEFFAEGFEDPRLAATVYRVGDQAGTWGTINEENTGMPHQYYAKKYFSDQSELAPFGDPNPNGGSNDRVIRYADVLLMHAEAAYHNGAAEDARTSLNLVRARVGLDPVIAGGPALLQAIYHERRVELGLEGHRFFDLVRTGRAQFVLADKGYIEGTHNIFPVPLSQIQATNGSITQNPGY